MMHGKVEGCHDGSCQECRRGMEQIPACGSQKVAGQLPPPSQISELWSDALLTLVPHVLGPFVMALEIRCGVA